MSTPTANDNSTTNTVKMLADAASLAMTGYAVYSSVNKMVNPLAKKAAGSDVITKATKAVTDTINKQIELLAASVNKILPEAVQLRAGAAKLPTTNLPS